MPPMLGGEPPRLEEKDCRTFCRTVFHHQVVRSDSALSESRWSVFNARGAELLELFTVFRPSRVPLSCRLSWFCNNPNI